MHGRYRAPTIKQYLAAIRRLFDWLVIGQVMPINPATSVRGPTHVVRTGKTPVLQPAEARLLLDTIDTSTLPGLRDRALLAVMVYSFARVSAVVGMRVEDDYQQGRPRPEDALATLATQQADQARQSTEAGVERRPVLTRRDEAGRARHPEGRNVAADGEAVDTPGA